jgi:hypothetical protein
MTEPHTIELMGQTYTVREDMVEAIWDYVNYGTPVGSFLYAVLAHDLVRACQHADHWNLPNLPAYAHFLYWEVPSPCHGSYSAVDAWIEKGGAKGNGIST